MGWAPSAKNYGTSQAVGCSKKIQERGIIESNLEFANYANELFHHLFLLECLIQLIVEKPAAVKNLVFDNENVFSIIVSVTI